MSPTFLNLTVMVNVSIFIFHENESESPFWKTRVARRKTFPPPVTAQQVSVGLQPG